MKLTPRHDAPVSETPQVVRETAPTQRQFAMAENGNGHGEKASFAAREAVEGSACETRRLSQQPRHDVAQRATATRSKIFGAVGAFLAKILRCFSRPRVKGRN